MSIERERLQELDRTVRLDIRRHGFTERERQILETILDYSFAVGRETAIIPKLDDFAELTGITRGNVHLILFGSKQKVGLVGVGVVSVEGQTYRVLPRSANCPWLIRPAVNMERAEALTRQLLDLNSVTQGELIREEPTLRQSMATVAVERALSTPSGASFVPNLGTDRGGQGKDPVPESGTFVPNSGTKVPKLGTPFKLEAQRSSKLKASSAQERIRGERTHATGVDRAKLPDIEDHELDHVPDFIGNLHFQAWCIRLEGIWGQWMGTGSKETWAESFGGWWWSRYTQDPARFKSVWNETLSMAREGKITDTIGGCAYDLWKHKRVGCT